MRTVSTDPFNYPTFSPTGNKFGRPKTMHVSKFGYVKSRFNAATSKCRWKRVRLGSLPHFDSTGYVSLKSVRSWIESHKNALPTPCHPWDNGCPIGFRVSIDDQLVTKKRESATTPDAGATRRGDERGATPAIGRPLPPPRGGWEKRAQISQTKETLGFERRVREREESRGRAEKLEVNGRERRSGNASQGV